MSRSSLPLLAFLGLASLFAIAPLAACSSSSDDGNDAGGADAGSDSTTTTATDADAAPVLDGSPHDVTVVEAGPPGNRNGFCSLPGSVVYSASGVTQIGGGKSFPSFSWATVPDGFCIHYFGRVGNARQMRFSPSGDLFVSSPTEGTTGGGSGGRAAIVVLTDDDGDGFDDALTTSAGDVADDAALFMDNLPATQGILFADGGTSFYYQDTDPQNTEEQVGTQIRKVAYQRGQRSGDKTQSTVAITVNQYYSGTHWPKTLDQADDGTIYVGNGGDQGEQCTGSELTSFPRPFHGGVLKIDGTPNGSEVAMGFRNPIDVKCEHGKGSCFTTELSLDYSGADEGREKLVTIHQGDDWGYPCCATANQKYLSVQGNPNCSQVQSDTVSFIIGHTPFGFDFTPASWNAVAGDTWSNRVFVALHGVFGTWQGARVVGIEIDPTTGQPKMATELDGGTPSTMSDFVVGYDDGKRDHGRPADVTFAADGRMFLANDDNGDIVWIAPIGLGVTDGGASETGDAGTDVDGG